MGRVLDLFHPETSIALSKSARGQQRLPRGDSDKGSIRPPATMRACGTR